MDLRITYTAADARRLFCCLIAIEILLIALYLAINILATQLHWGPSRTLFDLDADLSVPAWFSSMQLMFVAAFLYLSFRNNRQPERVSQPFLLLACLGFVFLSADESAAIHEKITLVALTFHIDWLLIGGKHGAWITVYGLLVLPPALFSLRAVLRIWRYFPRESLLMAVGMAVLFVGAVGLELVSYLFLRAATEGAAYKLEVASEEFLEMSGISIVLYATLRFAAAISVPATPMHSAPRATTAAVPQTV